MKLKYLPVLDGVRALAVIFVFASHIPFKSLPGGFRGALPGSYGVTVFFFLSGFLITSLLRAEWVDTGHISLRSFYLRRAKRILPPLYIVLAIVWTLDAFGIPSHQSTGLGITSILFYFYNYPSLLKPLAASAVVIMLVSLMMRNAIYRETLRYTVEGVCLFPIFYFIVSTPGSWAGKFLAWRPIRWVGWTSYTIYLINLSMISIFVAYTHWSPLLAGLGAAIACGLFAEAVRRWVENPLRTMKVRMRTEVEAGPLITQ